MHPNTKAQMLLLINTEAIFNACWPVQISFINDLHRCYCLLTYKHVIFAYLQTCYFLLTYKHVICCWPTNMLFLLTYKHVICCWPTCTNKLFVADLQTCCTVLVAVIHRCYLLLSTKMLFVADLHTCCLLLIYKHDICCWPTQMSCTSSGATFESFRTAWNTGTSRSSGKVSCKEHSIYYCYTVHLERFLQRTLYKLVLHSINDSQEKVNCSFQPLFSIFFTVFKKNSC